MAGGRPTIYNKEIADMICDRVATHACGLARLCAQYDDMPDKNTVNLWRYKHNEFSVQYAKSKLMQADLLAEETIELSESRPFQVDENGRRFIDSGEANMIRTQIDTLKWHASKLLPKQYGKAAEESPRDDMQAIMDKLIDKLPNNNV